LNESINKLKNDLSETNYKLNENNKKLNEIKDLINELNLKINTSSLPNNYEEQIIAIQIISEEQKINYCIPCKKDEHFVKLEEILYKEYPKLAESDNYFTFNSKKINRFKSFIENGLKNGDKVILHSNK
jgi:uncharacterized coiled-coil DUF342 family protein